jgi:putative ubiquitin-RnfH superfamily antitoxin RatB of RatAB toxin-antitoxin module
VTIRVSVAVALPGRQEVVELELPEGSTVDDAVRAARVLERYPQSGLSLERVGIWNKACAPAARLREGDRVELYRPLAADPKQMRRARARRKA